MAALIVNMLNIVNSMLIKQFKSYELSKNNQSSETAEDHSNHLARPPIYHQVLETKFIDRFDEIVVIGDVHGCYDEMIELINQIESTKPNQTTKILKIFVGDLINKGRKNIEVINYMMSHLDDCLSVGIFDFLFLSNF